MVLVNVMGQWLGGIMNLPSTGSTGSALLTSGGTQVTQNPTAKNSTTQADVTNTNNTNITNAPTGSITNNVTASAQSGGVTATDSAQVGNLTSGNANVATGVANLFGSTLNLSNWFGILVINVFGDWTGGVNQADPAGLSSGSTTATAVDPVVAATVIQNVSRAVGASVGQTASGISSGASSSNIFLAATKGSGLAAVPNITAKAAAQTKGSGLLLEIAAGALLIAGAIGSADRRMRRR